MLPSERPNVVLDVLGREHLRVKDEVADVRRPLRDRVDHCLAKRLAPGSVPLVPGGQLVGRVLDEAAHHVLAGRRHGPIDEGRDDHVDVRTPAEAPRLCIVVGKLHVVDPRAEADRATQVLAFAGQACELGKPVQREIHLPAGAAVPVALYVLEKRRIEQPGREEPDERLLWVQARQRHPPGHFFARAHDGAGYFVPSGQDLLDGGLGADLDAERPSRTRDRLTDRAGSSTRNSPGPQDAVDLAHVVVEKDVGGPRGADPLKRPDDPRGAHRGYERVGLEPLAEKVRGAHRHQLDEDRLLLAGKVVERSGETRDRQPFAGTEPAGVRRRQGQDRLDELRHLEHQPAVLLVRLRVARRPTPKLADRAAMVVHPPQVIVLEGGERPVERQDLETVLRELELADDLGAEERDDVRGDAEPKAREDLLGHRRTAEDVAPLEHHDLESCACEVRGGHQPVVAAADDHGVVRVGVRHQRRH